MRDFIKSIKDKIVGVIVLIAVIIATLTGCATTL